MRRDIVLVVLLCLLNGSSVFADGPGYLPVQSSYSDYHSGYQEVYNSVQGSNYGKAKIEWSYWNDSSSDYWYYAYKICDNESGAANDRTDDYHFGHVYNSGTASPITSFDLEFGTQIAKVSDQLLVSSTMAGSSAGGAAWDAITKGTDSAITGVQWSTLGPGIQPTQWYWQRVSGKFVWVETYSGDTSRIDSLNNQYFEIASKYAPGIINAYVSNGLITTDTSAFGNVYGPSVVPEPATMAILAMGGCGLLGLGKRHK
jgi:hypothetical protein